MNTSDFSLIKDQLKDRLPTPHGEKAASVMEEFERDGKILVLDAVEAQLLQAFRDWRNSNASASGVFHYRPADKKTGGERHRSET